MSRFNLSQIDRGLELTGVVPVVLVSRPKIFGGLSETFYENVNVNIKVFLQSGLTSCSVEKKRYAVNVGDSNGSFNCYLPRHHSTQTLWVVLTLTSGGIRDSHLTSSTLVYR